MCAYICIIYRRCDVAFIKRPQFKPQEEKEEVPQLSIGASVDYDV